MNVTGIVLAAVLVGVVGLLIGLFLGIAGIKFKVEVDEKEELILGTLPGNNCGGCGYAGCSGLASAILKGEAVVDACPVGGEPVAVKIAQILGVSANAQEKKVAFVKCQGDCGKTKVDYSYAGVQDCNMLSFVPNGGPKSCNQGCLGYGACVKACPFDAIRIELGVAVVDKEKCKACGKCIAACPKNLIELIPYKNKFAVACSNIEKGPIAMKSCEVACIACTLCQKNCPHDAIVIEKFNANIQYDKCTNCGTCASKCPKKAIIEI